MIIALAVDISDTAFRVLLGLCVPFDRTVSKTLAAIFFVTNYGCVEAGINQKSTHGISEPHCV